MEDMTAQTGFLKITGDALKEDLKKELATKKTAVEVEEDTFDVVEDNGAHKQLPPDEYLEHFKDAKHVSELIGRIAAVKEAYLKHGTASFSSTDSPEEAFAGASGGDSPLKSLFMAVEEHAVLLIALLHWVGLGSKSGLNAATQTLLTELLIDGLAFKRTILADDKVQPLLAYAREVHGVMAF